MKTYWNCSKFADVIRGTPKPNSATADGWDEWDKTAKEAHPIRFWIVETLFGWIEDAFYFIPTKISTMRHRFRNRFITKTHALTSNLVKGDWYELDHRMLHCLFDELVKHVEVELAYMNAGEYDGKYVRSASAGVAYLKWAMALINDESCGVSKSDERYGTPTSQAIAAREIFELYNWWKNIYPNRPDALEESGWSSVCDEVNVLSQNLSQDVRARIKEASTKLSQMEEHYITEEDEMLIRLVKVRHHLWT